MSKAPENNRRWVRMHTVKPCSPVVAGDSLVCDIRSSMCTGGTRFIGKSTRLLEVKGWEETSQASAQGGDRDISDTDELVACSHSLDDG